MPQAMSIAVDGSDHLLFRHMAWNEALGEVPRGTVDLLSLEKTVDPRKVLGKQVKIRLELPHKQERFFNGYVARFTRGGGVGRYFEYVAEVRPWLWLLSRTADCRIFQRMKVDAVLRAVFDRHAFADYELKLNGSYPEMDYCVQYRETDLAFVNRLCERFGLYYWFEYTSDGHQKLRIVDSLSTHDDAKGYESLPFHPATSNPLDSEHISSLHAIDPLLSGKFVAQDYNYETSSLDLKAEAKVDHKYDHGDLEVFDYPGPFVDPDTGSAEAKLRSEISECTFATYDAVTNAQGIRTGHTFKVTQHPDADINNKKFQVTSSSISMHWAGYESHGADQGASFRCTFTSIPANVQFRLPRRTEKPVVYGPQTAVVVGPDGEEIHTDKLGRVRVLFHWDRYGKGKKAKDGAAIASDDRSCWIRVAQFWAGNRFGSVFIPRIGHEVVVDFIDGDPDRPIATGCVYNDKNPPPWLPDNPTQSGILTRSSKGGSAANANAIRFEDKKGSEQVWLHAEKNQDIEVENDETHWVGHDRKKTVDHDETTHVKHDRTETVDNNETITIGVNRTESVGSNESITIGANRTISVGGSETATVAVQRTHAVGANESIAIGAAQEIAIGAAQTVAVGAAQAVSIGANQTLDVGKDRTMSVGANLTSTVGKDETRTVSEGRSTTIGKDDKTQVGKKFFLDAGDEIALKTGDASITMKKDGTIQIKGKDITITGSGKITVKASGDMVLKGSKIAEN
jgi:type VI secretion system secreted protein VgrG